ncbi:glia maturation factor gamma-like [Saccoglossus kowalevskii]|uniref:Glia maturation factor gamma-like n=1 Tax=Saccoglossus kowalevskii TaxID=10224 RepID=A0ABM0GSV7_SACKO|nr:PREDICTED: glia maturation factor gamma-like [Saccoglossus kowalevskii]
MSQAVTVCDVDGELKAKLKKFRLRRAKNNAAIIMKIDRESLLIKFEEEFEDCSLEDLQDELPSSQPRFLLYSYCYTHDDGRVSYPLVFIHISPQGGKPELHMMYAGSKINLVNETGQTKVYEVRHVDELTEDWLKEKLSVLR